MESENPYRSPAAGARDHAAAQQPAADGSPAEAQMWWDGRDLVCPAQAQLPNRCVKCGDVGDGQALRIRLRWHHPIVWLFVLLGLFPYVIAAAIATKETYVDLFLCPVHRRRRRVRVRFTWLIAAVALAWIAFAVGMEPGGRRSAESMLVLGLVGLITGPMLWHSFAKRIVTVVRITDRDVWLRGVARDFLRGM